MPTALLMRMDELGAMRLVSITASMIAAFVRFALASTTKLDDALECFTVHVEDLPLAHRSYASPPRWSGACMAGALKRTIGGDLQLWPRGLRAAVAAAVAAAREAHAAERPRRAQAAAYAAARTALFAGEITHMMHERLARQLAADPDSPVVLGVTAGLPSLSIRASFLGIRGATNAICCGSRMQTEGASCAYCSDGPDSLRHFGLCRLALVPFCLAHGVPPTDSIRSLLESAPLQAPRLWASFSEYVGTVSACRAEVAARGPCFVEAAAAAAARAHPPPADRVAKGRGRHRRPPAARVAARAAD